MAFFEGNKMTGGYGSGPDIINSCSVNVERGEIVSILGPNGAGKSTAMKAMLGLLNLKSGSIIIDGKDISKLSPQDRVKKGISFVPQTKNVFAGMTVEENLEMGAFLINSDFKSVIDEIYDLFPIHDWYLNNNIHQNLIGSNLNMTHRTLKYMIIVRTNSHIDFICICQITRLFTSCGVRSLFSSGTGLIPSLLSKITQTETTSCSFSEYVHKRCK